MCAQSTVGLPGGLIKREMMMIECNSRHGRQMIRQTHVLQRIAQGEHTAQAKWMRKNEPPAGAPTHTTAAAGRESKLSQSTVPTADAAHTDTHTRHTHAKPKTVRTRTKRSHSHGPRATWSPGHRHCTTAGDTADGERYLHAHRQHSTHTVQYNSVLAADTSRANRQAAHGRGA